MMVQQMEKLRKEKEAEKKREFQAKQQIMCDNLQMHMETKTSDEDQRIADIVQKQLAKRDVSDASNPSDDIISILLDKRLNNMKNR